MERERGVGEREKEEMERVEERETGKEVGEKEGKGKGG